MRMSGEFFYTWGLCAFMDTGMASCSIKDDYVSDGQLSGSKIDFLYYKWHL